MEQKEIERLKKVEEEHNKLIDVLKRCLDLSYYEDEYENGKHYENCTINTKDISLEDYIFLGLLTGKVNR